MRHVVADIESDNLLDSLTVIHCLVLRDLETDEVLSCTDEAPPEWYQVKGEKYRRSDIGIGLAVLHEAERVYWHNGIGFDVSALEKIRQFKSDRSKVRDTLVIAQMRFAHIKDRDFAVAKAGKLPKNLIGSHKLEAWGYRLGEYKGEYTDWCKSKGITDPWKDWRPEMQTYCEQDTVTTKALVLHLRKFAPSTESIEIEHALAWYLVAQERAGVPFDRDKAIALQGRLAARRQELEMSLREDFGPLYRKDGKEFTPKKDDKKKGYVAGCPLQKLKLVEFNPGSRQHIEFKLKALFNWQPTEYTDNGQAKIDEKTLKGLNQDIPVVKTLLEYLLIEKRLGQLAEGKEAWLSHATKDKPAGGQLTGLWHIHHRVKQNAAITHRATHSNPSLAQVPKVGVPFGADCRELFMVPDGWVMVGADASSLEARCLAHYMARYDGGEYGKLLLTGDVHTANRIALGLPEGKAERDKAKTFFYAFLYGAGDEKLGTIVKPGASQAERKALGAKLKKQFLTNTPALKHLIDAVQKSAREKGYLTLIDGRRTYIRSEHAALNTLLQSAGSILVKTWIKNFSRRLIERFGEPGWNGSWCPLLFIHDECDLAVRPDIKDEVCAILLKEMRALTQHYNWRVALDGDVKVGTTWKAVH